jgi:hydrogenase maturation protease
MNAAGVLVIGYGNPGRLDDGLGPAAAAAVEELHLAGVTVESDYQLTVEDAELVSRHRLALFIDAAVSGAEPFSLQRVQEQADASFSSHSVNAGQVMHLAHELFAADAAGYVLGIRGYAFNDFSEQLSPPARHNLDAAVAFLAELLRNSDVDAVIAQLEARATT